jgi:hypothetical protein
VIVRTSRLIPTTLAVALLAACGGSNLVGPANQLQVANVADNFQWQVTGLNNVTQSFQYSWSNTGDSANVNIASSITGGSATLTISGPNNAVIYSGSLGANGTFHTAKSTAGTWTIAVALDKCDGTLNFRVQKAP